MYKSHLEEHPCLMIILRRKTCPGSESCVTEKYSFLSAFCGCKSQAYKSGEKATTLKTVTFSNTYRTFPLTPRPFSEKRKINPCRGFSRWISSHAALLWQHALTAQMENVETFIRVLFQLHQAEASGISLISLPFFILFQVSQVRGWMWIKMHNT